MVPLSIKINLTSNVKSGYCKSYFYLTPRIKLELSNVNNSGLKNGLIVTASRELSLIGPSDRLLVSLTL